MATYGNGRVVFTFDDKGLKRIQNMLDRLSPVKQDSAAKKGFEKLTAAVEYQLKAKTLRGEVLKYRTGRLSSSIGSLVRRVKGDFYGIVGSGVRTGKRLPYANIHETGGVIRPRPENPTGFLWIPIRKGGVIAIERGLSTRRISSSSKVLGFIKVRSVTIPERRYMSKAVEKVEPRATDIMLKEIDAVANRA